MQVGTNVYATEFYIYSVERAGRECWWKPRQLGYTADLVHAGRYTLDEVNAILARSRGEDIPVPVTLVSIIADVVRPIARDQAVMHS